MDKGEREEERLRREKVEVRERVERIEGKVEELCENENVLDRRDGEVSSELSAVEGETGKLREKLEAVRAVERRVGSETERLERIDKERLREGEKGRRVIKLRRMKAKKVLDEMESEGSRLREVVAGLKAKLGVEENTTADEKFVYEVGKIRREKVLKEKLVMITNLKKRTTDKEEATTDRIDNLDR